MKLRILFLTLSACICYHTNAQELRFNEVMTLNDYYYSDNGNAYPWIEFVNTSDTTVNLSNFYISTDSTDLKNWRLPDVNIDSGSLSLLWLSEDTLQNHTDFKIDSARYLLLSDSSGNILDFVPLTTMVLNESYGRRPVAFDQWIYFSDDTHITPGTLNIDTAPWVKVQQHAAFPKGDAGYIGSVVYDDKMWILDYETMDSAGTWIQLPVVWNSSDGYNWQLINSSPPYCHGSMVTVFKDSLWAFDGRAFRSHDGITWEQVSFNTPVAERIAVFKDTLWVLDENALYRSGDGINWEVASDSLPWAYRRWPAFLEHDGKLWMYGGNKNYNTGSDFYFQDVWNSEDGIHWELVTSEAPWRGGFWFTYVSHDDRLWMIEGGWSYWDRNDMKNGNGNDVWVSMHGDDWQKVEAPVVWYPRHAQFTWVFQNEVWIAAGYAGGGPHHLFNDVWRFSKLRQDLSLEMDVIELTYGDTLSVSSTSGLLVEYSVSDTLVAKQSSRYLTPSSSGETVVTIAQQGNEVYEPVEKEVKLVIKKKDLNVSPLPVSRTFGDTLAAIPLYYTGFVGSDNESSLKVKPAVKTLPAKTAEAGQYTVIPEGGIDDRYEFVYSEGELTVRKRNLFVRADNLHITYGDSIPPIGLTYSNFAEGDDVSVLDVLPVIQNAPTKMFEAGVYPLIPTGGSDNNYNFNYFKTSKIQIDKKDLLIEPEKVELLFGDPIPEIQFVYTGFVHNESENVLDEHPVIKNVPLRYSPIGVYPLVPEGGKDNNYVITLKSSIIEIKQTGEEVIYLLPNPVRSELTIRSSTILKEEALIQIFNSSGALVLQTTFSNLNYANIDMAQFEPGFYIVQYMTSKASITRKIIKY